MKKIVLILLLIGFILVPQVFAQVRFDLGLVYPFRLGVITDELNSSGDSEDFGTMIDYVFLVPEVGVAYQFDAGPLKMGVGLRGYSLILETLMWPEIYAEFEISRLVLNANVGGLALIYFGLANGAVSGGFVVPDISLGFKLGKSFRVCVGAIGLMGSDLDTSTVPYVAYVAGRFRFLMNEAEED